MQQPRTAARFVPLLRDSHGAASPWIQSTGVRSWVEPIAIVVVASAAYGAAMGAWRAPHLALLVALKLPLLFLATALVDAFANGLWAQRLGAAISFAESLRAVLLSFALASVVLAAIAPVLAFFALALPGPDSSDARVAHDVLGLAHVVAIALAGTIAVARQSAWLRAVDARAHAPRAVIAVWLAVNLVAGAQLSWILRPWFGSPGMEVAFLREHPFDGTFYESVLRMVLHD